jgi:hypothetical protein
VSGKSGEYLATSGFYDTFVLPSGGGLFERVFDQG